MSSSSSRLIENFRFLPFSRHYSHYRRIKIFQMWPLIVRLWKFYQFSTTKWVIFGLIFFIHIFSLFETSSWIGWPISIHTFPLPCVNRFISLLLSLSLSDAIEILTKSIYKTNIYQLTSRPLSKLFSPQRSFSQCIWTMFVFDMSPSSLPLSGYPLFRYQINIRLNSVFYLKFLKKAATLFLP